MREIKFRAWEVSILPSGTIRKKMHSTTDLLGWGEIPSPMLNTGFTDDELDKGELWVWMQYTGLKDKDGKEIYEGDIICLTDGMGDKRNQVMEWIDHAYWLRFPSGICHLPHREYLEVIGNIYENPELLEQENPK